MEIKEFQYRTYQTIYGHRQGFHRSTQAGVDLVFKGYTSLLNYPDPRRVDVRASLYSPFEEIMVRQSRHKISMPVIAIADLSASLGNKDNQSKLNMLADFSSSLAYSVYQTGDSFRFIGCDSEIRNEFSQISSKNKSTACVISELLSNYQPVGTSSTGLLDAAELLPARHALVFLISDFYFPIELLKEIMDALASHSVIPVILQDSSEGEEFCTSRAHGFVRVTDNETGTTRILFMRPSLRKSIRDIYASHCNALISVFQSRGIRPLFIKNHFNADDVSRYFLDNMPT